MNDMEMDFENRIVAPEYTPMDEDNERSLRPLCLNDYVGQDKAKDKASIQTSSLGPEISNKTLSGFTTAT